MTKHLNRNIIIILLITVVSLVINIPQLKINEINFKIGSIQIMKKLEIKQGLDLVGGTRLVFELDTSKLPESEIADALESSREVIERRVNLFGVSESNIQLSQFDGKKRILVELPGITDTKEAVNLVGKTAQLIFAEIGEDEKTLTPSDLTGADLKKAAVTFHQVTGKPVVQLDFTDEGEKKFSEITERNVGKPLPILLDSSLLSAPIVNQKISGGSAIIEGEFDLKAAKELSIQLNAGALPVPAKLVEERTIGATLGKESVEKSIKAGIVGLSIVAVFMLIMYGRLGIIANIGLLIFALISISLYKIFPIVLTLPGIAGLLLSVGMAVDSNILVFERYKEEKKKGVSTAYALETSFGKAWDSIRDANISTLATCFILANPFNWQFLNTSGPVRGFAFTLALGIAVSLFTGIFVSRNLLRFIIRK